ncbi:MAG: hypothetical protein AAGD22_16145 [Verrucomicrobiota bacterium]
MSAASKTKLRFDADAAVGPPALFVRRVRTNLSGVAIGRETQGAGMKKEEGWAILLRPPKGRRRGGSRQSG